MGPSALLHCNEFALDLQKMWKLWIIDFEQLHVSWEYTGYELNVFKCTQKLAINTHPIFEFTGSKISPEDKNNFYSVYNSPLNETGEHLFYYYVVSLYLVLNSIQTFSAFHKTFQASIGLN